MHPRTGRTPRAGLAAISLLLLVGACAAAQQAWPPAPPIDVSAGAVVEPKGLPPSIVAVPTNGGFRRVRFEHKPDAAVRSVALAGTFNGWNAQAQPMLGPDASGVWHAELELGAGEYQYKFVLDGGRWVHDPQNPATISDGHSGFNSVLNLGELANMSESREKPGDEKINPVGLGHDSRLPLYFQPLDMNRVLIRYRTLARDASRVAVAIRGGAETEMSRCSTGPLFDTWEAVAMLPQSRAAEREIEYAFVLADPAKRVSDPRTYKARIVERDIFRTPAWARDVIWYQIMLDRFRNADPANDPSPVRPWTSDWFGQSDFETKTGETFYKHFVYRRMYGGDLKGLDEKLAYLKELGVTGIYLNPIFQADTHHKYNATNYLHVDEHFGTRGDYAAAEAKEDLLDPKTWTWTETDRLFLAVLKRAKAMGFRVILDGVFNHVGVLHPAFVDVKRNGRKSRFADWFEITRWEPFEYKGWAGVSDLPEFRKSETGLASAAATQHIFDVTRRWMDPDGDGDPSDGIDGWRLDVPNEVPAPFWVEWRRLVKSINPEAYIVGEIWDRADTWLDGRHFDAVMNYPFAASAVAWIGHRDKKIKASQIDARLAELRQAYPAAATYVMQNLVDSHDTDRLVSMIHNPDRAYDHANRVQDNGPKYDNSKPGAESYARARLVALLQMTYVGAPMVYYGDEVGMWGADDPTCRKPMLWEDLQPYEKPDENFVMRDHLEFYRRAIALRRENPALRDGSFETVLVDDAADVWAFERRSGNQRLIVVLNASAKPRDAAIPLSPDAPRVWTTVFGDASPGVSSGRLSVKLAPISGVVLRAK